MLIFILDSCRKERTPQSTPEISTSSSFLTIVEDVPAASVSMPVILSGRSDKEVSIDL